MESPDELTIRKGTPADLDAVVALGMIVQSMHAQHLPELFSEPDVEALQEFFRPRLADDSILLVATRGAIVVGYLYADHIMSDAGPFTRALSLLQIQHIAVDPKAQGQRVGARLMTSAVDEGARLGVSAIRLDSWSFNVEAHQFFDKQGFSPARLLFERSLQSAHDG